MKSYFQGLITGGVMVFAMFVLMGQQVKKAYATTQKEALVSLQKSTEIREYIMKQKKSNIKWSIDIDPIDLY